MRKRTLHIITFLLAAFVTAKGQDAVFKVSPDTNKVRIGEHISLELRGRAAAGSVIIWPEITDRLSPEIEIIRAHTPDTTITKNYIEIVSKLVITSFDTGYHVVTPMSMKYTGTGTDTSEVLSEAFLIHVAGLTIDLTEDIKDIKDPLKVAFTFREALPYILSVIIAALLIFGIIVLYRRLRRGGKGGILPAKPTEPPHITALRELEKLRQKKIWEKGEIKTYYTLLTDILRIYIEEAQSVPAVEMTSKEITDTLKSKGIISDSLLKDISFILQTADLVKFAKASPLPGVHEQCLKYSFNYVRESSENLLKPGDDES